MIELKSSKSSKKLKKAQKAQICYKWAKKLRFAIIELKSAVLLLLS